MAIAGSLAFLVSGCTDAIFPAVHDMPSARSDTTLTPDQVKQATDDLITQREHLSTEVQTAAQPPLPNAAANATPAKKPSSAQGAAQTSAAPTSSAGTAVTAGAYAKP
jgi:hypothetical protein